MLLRRRRGMPAWGEAEPERRCYRYRAVNRPRRLPLQVQRVASACRSCATPLLSPPSSWGAKTAAICVRTRHQSLSYRWATSSAHLFQLVDHARNHRQPTFPELGILGVEAERLEQFGIMLGAAGSQHRQIALGEAARGMFVDRVKRVHQAIAKRIGIDVERRMDEVRDIHPEILVTRADVDRGTEAFALHAEPDFADALRSQFAVAPLSMDGAFEGIERDLPHYRVDHVLDLAGEQGLALPGARGLRQQPLEGQHFAEHAGGLGERQRR